MDAAVREGRTSVLCPLVDGGRDSGVRSLPPCSVAAEDWWLALERIVSNREVTRQPLPVDRLRHEEQQVVEGREEDHLERWMHDSFSDWSRGAFAACFRGTRGSGQQLIRRQAREVEWREGKHHPTSTHRQPDWRGARTTQPTGKKQLSVVRFSLSLLLSILL